VTRLSALFGSLSRLALLVLLLSAALQASATAGPAPKVLVLHSYHKSFEWTDAVQDGIERVLLAERPEIELHVEYLNLKRNSALLTYPTLAALFQNTLATLDFDCILCSDDAALDFLLLYRATLFKNAPVIFCGINDYKPTRTRGQSGYTGVAEAYEFAETIGVGRRLFPGAKKIAIITDASDTGVINLKHARSQYPRFPDLEFLELTGLAPEALSVALGKLGPEALVLSFTYIRLPDGRSLTPRESIAFLGKASPRPVLTLWDFFLGPGLLGGRIVSGAKQGEAAARIALRVLAGERPEAIPVGASPNAFVFEHETLERFGVDPERLPPDSLVLHKPDSLYERYRYRIWAVIAALLLQSLTIALLLRGRRGRKKAERALRESDARFRQLSDATWEGIMVHDNGVLVEANPQFFELTGYKFEELIGKQLIDTPLFQESADYLRRQLAEGNYGPYEVKGLHKSGRELYIEIRAKRLDYHGRTLRVAALRDVTSRKRAEFDRETMQNQLEQLVEERTEDLNQKTKELEIANYELRRLDELKSTFLNTVSHDLRTPLTSIMGFIKLIRREFLKHFLPISRQDLALDKKGQRIADNLAIIEKESERLTRLINDLLDISRMEADQGKWRDIPVAPARIIEDAVNACKGALLEKPNVALLLDVPADLPLVHADPDKLIQVLANLLSNAVKFTVKGHVAIRAERAPAEMLRIRVADTGSGIPAQDLARIFDKFFQAGSDTLVEQPKGTGMGLAICKLIVEHYRGRIWAESTLGQGAAFYVELPVMPELDEQYPEGS
jgi:PAS domain S-box-containing protein